MNEYVYKILDAVSWIDDVKLRGLVKNFFSNYVPDYFFKIPASSTGKYHPDQDLGKGGLVRHTLMDVTIAYELLEMDQYAKLRDFKDEIVAALLLHDSFKMGDTEGDHTIHEHPLIAANHFKEYCKWCDKWDDRHKMIARGIACHSGQWITSKYSNVVLPKPRSSFEKFVHLCDYIGSRKFIGNLDKYD